MSHVLNSTAPSMGVEVPEQQVENERKRQCANSGLDKIRMVACMERVVTKGAEKSRL